MLGRVDSSRKQDIAIRALLDLTMHPGSAVCAAFPQLHVSNYFYKIDAHHLHVVGYLQTSISHIAG